MRSPSRHVRTSSGRRAPRRRASRGRGRRARRGPDEARRGPPSRRPRPAPGGREPRGDRGGVRGGGAEADEARLADRDEPAAELDHAALRARGEALDLGGPAAAEGDLATGGALGEGAQRESPKSRFPARERAGRDGDGSSAGAVPSRARRARPARAAPPPRPARPGSRRCSRSAAGLTSRARAGPRRESGCGRRPGRRWSRRRRRAVRRRDELAHVLALEPEQRADDAAVARLRARAARASPARRRGGRARSRRRRCACGR